jgi:hypothetical protein
VCAGDNSSCADCAGTPNGPALEDNCGTCDTDGSNDCVQDCTGAWGGSATNETLYLDTDGDGYGAGDAYTLCNGFDLTGWAANNDDLEPDCSTNNTDACGVCAGDNSSCSDCFGTPYGSAYTDPHYGEDDCLINECVGGDTGQDSCLPDCAGRWGGILVNDECGVCDGNGSSCNQPIAHTKFIIN